MKLFDQDIIKLKKEMQGLPFRTLYEEPAGKSIHSGDSDPDLIWPMKEQPVLRSNMAYELGGGDRWAVGGLAFTREDIDLTDGIRSGVYLAGPDLAEVDRDISYARFTLIKLAEAQVNRTDRASWENGPGRLTDDGDVQENNENAAADELYRAMRKADYVKYRIHPEGYLLRISSVREREPVRVSREALAKGLSFEKVGRLFLREYLKLPEVERAQVYFVTAPGADYDRLQGYARRFEQITDSLNHIFNGLQMDCSTCGLKAVCDEVEGLRELHFGRQTTT